MNERTQWGGGGGEFRNYREGTRDPQVARMEFFLCQPVEYTIAMLEAHAVVQPNPSMLFSGGYHARLHAARGSRR